jgi:hypothetical protein
LRERAGVCERCFLMMGCDEVVCDKVVYNKVVCV